MRARVPFIALLVGSGFVAAQAEAGFLIEDPADVTTALVDPTDLTGSPSPGNLDKAAFNAIVNKAVFDFDEAGNSDPSDSFLSSAPGQVAITNATASVPNFTATFSASGGGFAVLTGGGFGSFATSDGGYLATNRETVTITFDTGVAAIAMTINRLLDDNSTVTVFDTSAQSLGTFNLAGIPTDQGSIQNFFGFQAPNGSAIGSVVITNAAPGNQIGIDDFGVAPVIPEPAAIGLVGLGVALMLSRQRS